MRLKLRKPLAATTAANPRMKLHCIRRGNLPSLHGGVGYAEQDIKVCAIVRRDVTAWIAALSLVQLVAGRARRHVGMENRLAIFWRGSLQRCSDLQI